MAGRGRKAGVTLLIFVFVIASMAALAKLAQSVFNRERPIFAMDDPKGDDHGPGKYKYPIDSIFDPKKEHLDLTKFTLSSQRDNYYFDLLFPLVTNPWGAPEGFSHTIVEIYISDDPDTGRIEPFKAGANVLFDLGSPWKYLVKVVSFNNTAVYRATDFDGAEGQRKGVSARLQPDKKTIRVTIPKTCLPGNPYSWKYYVLVGSQDGSGPDNFRVVRPIVGQYNFGGGTDTDFSPNVIDLLAPKGEQEKMLGSFSVAKKAQAIIKPVGPTEKAPRIWETLSDKYVELLHKMKIKL